MQNRKGDTDSKIIFIAYCNTCKNWLLNVESAILVWYYYQTAKTRALYESTDGPAGHPTDNPPISVRLKDFHRTLPVLTDWAYYPPGKPIWHRGGSKPDVDLKRRSRTVANTTIMCSDNSRFSLTTSFHCLTNPFLSYPCSSWFICCGGKIHLLPQPLVLAEEAKVRRWDTGITEADWTMASMYIWKILGR